MKNDTKWRMQKKHEERSTEHHNFGLFQTLSKDPSLIREGSNTDDTLFRRKTGTKVTV